MTFPAWGFCPSCWILYAENRMASVCLRFLQERRHSMASKLDSVTLLSCVHTASLVSTINYARRLCLQKILQGFAWMIGWSRRNFGDFPAEDVLFEKKLHTTSHRTSTPKETTAERTKRWGRLKLKRKSESRAGKTQPGTRRAHTWPPQLHWWPLCTQHQPRLESRGSGRGWATSGRI